MHPVCNKALNNADFLFAKQMYFCPECKVFGLGQIQYNRLLSTTLHIFKHGGGYIMLYVCLLYLMTGEFLGLKKVVLNTGKILDETPVQSAYHQTLIGGLSF